MRRVTFHILLSFQLQFLAFNKDLYSNYSHASKSPHGVAAVAVFGMVSAVHYLTPNLKQSETPTWTRPQSRPSLSLNHKDSASTPQALVSSNPN